MRLPFALASATLVFTLLAPAAEARIIRVKEGEKAPVINRHAGRKKVERGPINYEPYRLRNQQRQLDLTAIGNAFFRYRYAHKDLAPKAIQIDVEQEICRYGAADCAGLLDLEDEMKDFLADMPVDPQATNPNSTGYVIKKDHKERVWLRAPLAEKGWVIKNTR